MTRCGILKSCGLAATLLIGCGEASTTSPVVSMAPTGTEYLLPSEPAGGQNVVAARESAKEGEPITVVGRIGGDTTPWVEGLSVFKIVDASAKACSDIPGDGCPTPWDYCCEADLGTKTALVKVVGDDGKPLTTDARKLLGVTELQTVVVKGRAHRDDAGNLTVLADKIYVRPGSGIAAGKGAGAGHDHDGHDHDGHEAGHDHEGHNHEGHNHDAGDHADSDTKA